MKKIIIIDNDTPKKLQNYVNDWIKENQDVEIIDIKYSSWGLYNGYIEKNIFEYSALIIYKKNECREPDEKSETHGGPGRMYWQCNECGKEFCYCND